MKIQWICFNFDDALLERICLNMASRLKKECGENLKMFYRTFGMMDISIGYTTKWTNEMPPLSDKNYNKM